MAKESIQVDINRVEGDLEIRLDIEDKRVSDAYCSGTMFRGFEKLLKGRKYMDSLVLTPRICGICGTAHLYTAVTAIESTLKIPVAPNGTRVRNVCLLAEEIQSDCRHTFLMYTVDLCNPYYASSKYAPSLNEAFLPMKGQVYLESLHHTKKLLEIVALFGGQWPHSSYMVPGGVTLSPNLRPVIQSVSIVDDFISWYEKRILGCKFERWLDIKSVKDLQDWLNEKPEHKNSATGLFIRAGRYHELHKLGIGAGDLLSYGNYFDPESYDPRSENSPRSRPAGCYNPETKTIDIFRQELITEDVSHAWYDEQFEPLHPSVADTVPGYTHASNSYSWAKAPRYDRRPMEVGPLAEMVMDKDPLITDLFDRESSNAWLRQFSRLHRPVKSLLDLRRTLKELEKYHGDDYVIPVDSTTGDGEGFGLIHAARGALGHWISIQDGKIERYQIISPTGWNASPRDENGIPGHVEQTLVGTPLEDKKNPIHVGHIVRSHDACLVCTVHAAGAEPFRFRY